MRPTPATYRKVLDDILAKTKAGEIIPDGVHDYRLPPVAKSTQVEQEVKAFSKEISKLTSEQKINAVMWGVGAATGVLGVYKSAKNSVAVDGEGNRHMQWSNVGVTLLQGCLAVLCTYMGVQAVRGGRA